MFYVNIQSSLYSICPSSFIIMLYKRCFSLFLCRMPLSSSAGLRGWFCESGPDHLL